MIFDSLWMTALALSVVVLSIFVWVVAFFLFCMSVGALRRAWSSRRHKDSK